MAQEESLAVGGMEAQLESVAGQDVDGSILPPNILISSPERIQDVAPEDIPGQAVGDLLQDVGAAFAPEGIPGLADVDLIQDVGAAFAPGDIPGPADVGLLDFPTRPDDSLDSRPVLDQIDSMFEEDNTKDLASVLGSVGPARKEVAKMFRQLLVLEKKEAIRMDQDPEDFYGATTVTRL